MPFYAIDPDDIIEITLDQDEELAAGDKVHFSVKVLNALEMTKLQSLLVSFKNESETDEETVTVFASLINEINEQCKFIVKGWKNLKTRKGIEVPFDASKIMDFLPLDVIFEILSKTLAGNRLSKGEQGN